MPPKSIHFDILASVQEGLIQRIKEQIRIDLEIYGNSAWRVSKKGGIEYMGYAGLLESDKKERAQKKSRREAFE